MNSTESPEQGSDAFNGDDFSNNLFQDLGPLLSLFGAEATTQFMSQSLTWADNLLLSVGPLGVITIIVNAIRVGGPLPLRSFIGMAREPRAEVEAKIMSSTSKEVCEMWTGNSLIRLRGSSSVTELVISFDKDGGRPMNKELGIHRKEDRPEVIESGEDNELTLKNNLLDVEGRDSASEAHEDTLELKQSQDSFNPPNISLNYLPKHNTIELIFWGFISAILQATVLVVDGLMVYRWKWKKDDAPVVHTAYPLVLIGTLVLIVGLWICSAVIQHSSKETWYDIKKGQPVKILWLQRKAVVDDQHFQSYAIFASDKRRTIVASMREDYFQVDGTRPEDEKFTFRMLMVNFITICGVSASVVGYIMQFLGFRQMHWLCALLQFVLSIIMTAIRSYVRRDFTRQPNSQILPDGHELDWLATKRALYGVPNLKATDNQLSLSAVAPHEKEDQAGNYYSDRKYSSKKKSFPHRLGKLVLWAKRKSPPWYGSDLDRLAWYIHPATFVHPGEKDSIFLAANLEESERVNPGMILNVRCRLQMLTVGREGDLVSDIQPVAESLGTAFERVMAIISEPKLFVTQEDIKSTFEWGILVGDKQEVIKMFINKQNGRWITDRGAIEAAISLWMYDLSQKNTFNLTSKPGFPDLGLIALQTTVVKRECVWWIPGLEQSDSTDYDGDLIPLTNNTTSEYANTDLRYTFPSKSNAEKVKICAWHLLAIFMESLVDKIEKILGQSTTNLRKPELMIKFLRLKESVELENTSLQRLAEAVQDSGLCSAAQAYLAIIPALSAKDKLPAPDSLIRKVTQEARTLEKQQEWVDAAGLYTNLLEALHSFGAHSPVVRQAIAISAEYLTVLQSAKAVYDMQGDSVKLGECQLSEIIVHEKLSTCDTKDIRSIRDHYKCQGEHREMPNLRKSLILESSSKPKSMAIGIHLFPNKLFDDVITNKLDMLLVHLKTTDNIDAQDIFGWSPLHYACRIRHISALKACEILLKQRANPNLQTIIRLTPLHCAIKAQDESLINLLIQFGANINAKDARGKTPLHIASQIMDDRLVSALYEKGAEIDSRDNLELTPLHEAAIFGNMNIVSYLVKIQSNVRSREINGLTPLHYICGQTHCNTGVGAALSELIDAGASLSARDQQGRTPMHYASRSGCEEAITTLIAKVKSQHIGEAVSYILAQDQSFMTPFHWAAKGDNLNALKILITELNQSQCHEMLCQGDINGSSPLHIAVSSGSYQVLQFLLESGSDVNARDDQGKRPLHFCSSVKIAEYLLNQHADFDLCDNLGQKAIHCVRDPMVIRLLLQKRRYDTEKLEHWQDNENFTPLHRAVESEDIKAVTEHLLCNAHINALDKKQRSPLHIAVEKGNVELIIKLLNNHATPDQEDEDGLTPLNRAIETGNAASVSALLQSGIMVGQYGAHTAAKAGDKEIMALLLARIADKDFQNEEGNTPLHIAVDEGNMDIADMLVERGADFLIQNKAGQLAWDLIITKETREATKMKWKSTQKVA